MAILSETAYLNEAYDWIKYLSIGLGQEFKQFTGGAIHPHQDRARNETFLNRTEPPFNMEVFIKEAEQGAGPPFFEYWGEYFDMVSAELQRAYVDEVTVEEAMNTITDKADYLIAEGKLP